MFKDLLYTSEEVVIYHTIEGIIVRDKRQNKDHFLPVLKGETKDQFAIRIAQEVFNRWGINPIFVLRFFNLPVYRLLAIKKSKSSIQEKVVKHPMILDKEKALSFAAWLIKSGYNVTITAHYGDGRVEKVLEVSQMPS